MHLRLLGAAALALAAGAGPACHRALAQTNYNFQAAPGAPEASRQWDDPNNWIDGDGDMFVPNALFDERAIINNGAVAILNVSSPDSGESSVVTPGALQISNGGLDIRSAGALHVTANDFTPGTLTVGGSGVLTVNSGGVLTAETATLSGTTNLFPNAGFTTNGNVAMTGASAYNVGVTGLGSNGKINAGGAVSLGGSLSLGFSGFVPAVGQSWTVLEADSFTGAFSSVSSSGGLAYNETVVVSQADLGGGRQGLNATVGEVLVLEVNRDTGVATIAHPGSTTIALDGYFVGSDAGLLSANGADWNSFKESGALGSDWVETAQTPSNIGELKVGADVAFGADFNLGAIYNPLAGDFASAVDDLTFGYRRSSDGAISQGVVRYTGSKANTLVLQVDPSGSGDAYLRNTSGTTVQIDGYEVLSAGGALNEAGWDSLQDQAGLPNAWLEALNNGAGQLAEFDSEGFTTLSPGQSWNLGPLFSGGAQDLQFNFLMQGAEDGVAGLVIYEPFVPGEGVPGDFNQDNVVDAADYTVWRDNVGAASLPNDNGLGTVGSAHYDLWRSQYGATAAAATAAQSAPEPAAAVLLLAAATAVAGRRRGAAV